MYSTVQYNRNVSLLPTLYLPTSPGSNHVVIPRTLSPYVPAYLVLLPI
jgi:formylmethanofuran dehydrogenase subunit D